MNYGGGYGDDSGGGGFVANDATASSQNRGGRSEYAKDTVRPVTIKQLLSAHWAHPDANPKIDGYEIAQVTFVAQVRSIAHLTTNVTYKLDDGSGGVEAKRWADQSVDSGMGGMGGGDGETGDDGMDGEGVRKSREPKEGEYCRVWGKLKQFNNVTSVQAHMIRAVEDYNEVSYHLLEATAAHLFFRFGPPGELAAKKQQGMQNGGGGGMGYDGTGDGRQMPSHLSPQAKKLYAWAQGQSQTNEGLHVQMMASALRMEYHSAHNAATELADCGLFFTTTDDETFGCLPAE